MKLIIVYKGIINKQLKSQSISILELFITVKEPNIRYLALECVAAFSNLPYSEVIIQEKLESILVSLRDPDISIRRRALDILYLLCTAQISERVIEELIKYS
jgi:AP-2 complex subunit alpha